MRPNGVFGWSFEQEMTGTLHTSTDGACGGRKSGRHTHVQDLPCGQFTVQHAPPYGSSQVRYVHLPERLPLFAR